MYLIGWSTRVKGTIALTTFQGKKSFEIKEKEKRARFEICGLGQSFSKVVGDLAVRSRFLLPVVDVRSLAGLPPAVCSADFQQIGGAFGGNRGARPVPPEKGVFPLDHDHECDMEKKEYISCLKSSGHQSEKCRLFSKKYLQCRMAKNLMAKQDIEQLGFRKEIEADRPEDGNISTIKS